MGRPILIIKYPHSMPMDEYGSLSRRVADHKILNDEYYVFLIPNSNDFFEFKVFNGEYDEDEYSKLEELIEELKK